MASAVAKANSSSGSQMSSPVMIPEKASRNKRKFRADTPLVDLNKIMPSPHNECPTYEFSAKNFDLSQQSHGHTGACNMCGVNQDNLNALKLDLGLSNALGTITSFGSSESGARPSRPKEEVEGDEFYDADWSDLTESQLEELVLENLDTIFKSAIIKIVACGFTEEVATKAVLRSGLCYGCKDTVSNIVDNTLAFLKNGQEVDPSREHCFEDLQQLEKYILAELVCVLRAVRPFFSTGDAMWCLLICDMNVSHACAMDGDPLSSFVGEAVRTVGHTEDTPSSELNLPNPCKPDKSLMSCAHNTKPEMPKTKAKNSLITNGQNTETDGPKFSKSDVVDRSFGFSVTSSSSSLDEHVGPTRKVNSSISKRDSILRQKSIHLEKSYRAYGCKGSRKLSGLGGLMLDKKLKSVGSTTSVSIKSASLQITKEVGVINIPQDNPLPIVNSSIISTLPKPNTILALPIDTNPPVLSVADTELSLSLPTKSIAAPSTSPAPGPVRCNADVINSRFTGIPYDKTLGKWVPRDRKDEMILKLVPRVHDLQNQLQEWTEWANQKVMQAARRLSKDKAELKTLKQEKEEVERLKKEKQAFEENTMKKLSEMENALGKASGQVDRASSAFRRLEVENSALRQEMEGAKLRAFESDASCQEVSKREKKTLMKFQSWEKQKSFFQEELANEKRQLAALQQQVANAKDHQDQTEARYKQEEKAKEELLFQTASIKKEREHIEASSKSKEDATKLKAEANLQKYKADIQKLEKEISQMRLKTDSSKIAALRRGIDGNHSSRNSAPVHKEAQIPYISKLAADEHHQPGGVKRDRECVMCLSEEMSVVFLPCAHQVVCVSCNELHEKQGMKDCPSCRSTIQRRINVRYARP